MSKLADLHKWSERTSTKISEDFSYDAAAMAVLSRLYCAIDKVLKTSKLERVFALTSGMRVGQFTVQLLKYVYRADEFSYVVDLPKLSDV